MINLLPPQYKEELKKEENWKLIIIIGFLFLLFFLCLTLILFSIKIYISGQVSSQQILLDLKEKEFSQVQPLEEKFISINKNLSQLTSFYQEQVDFPEILERISEIIPSEISLTSFSYQKDISKISLSGFAPAISSLIELKSKLEEEELFEEIYFPADIWIQLNNIDFIVDFKIVK